MGDAKRGMENALRSDPLDIEEQYERKLKEPKEAYGGAMLKLRVERVAVPAGEGREVIETIRNGLKADGFDVSISKRCRWFGAPRRTVYYRPTKAGPVKAMIEEHPSFGYRTVVRLLGMNKNTVQRVFRLMP